MKHRFVKKNLRNAHIYNKKYFFCSHDWKLEKLYAQFGKWLTKRNFASFKCKFISLPQHHTNGSKQFLCASGQPVCIGIDVWVNVNVIYINNIFETNAKSKFAISTISLCSFVFFFHSIVIVGIILKIRLNKLIKRCYLLFYLRFSYTRMYINIALINYYSKDIIAMYRYQL